MIKRPSDIVVWAWVALDLVAFACFGGGFGRLFAQAWKRPDRWAAV